MNWICCQLGAREHYAVPRALQLNGLLGEFITDLWIRPGTLMHSWKKRLTGRFHPGLASAQVNAPNVAALTFELKASATRENGWKLISRRNEWFQRHAVDQLARNQLGNGTHTVFAYSYAAERRSSSLRASVAGERCWAKSIPVPLRNESLLVFTKRRKNANGNLRRQSTGIAGATNARWPIRSSSTLRGPEMRCSAKGTGGKNTCHASRLRTTSESRSFQRHYPTCFYFRASAASAVSGPDKFAKRSRQLLEAVKLLADENIEFWFVGPMQIEVPADLKEHPRVKWFGVAPRVEVDRYYRDADVFIFRRSQMALD